MYTGNTLILAAVALCIMCVAVSASSRRPGAAWNYYHFDGQTFVAGRPDADSPFLAVRDHTMPVVLKRTDRPEATPLPAGKGALVGICYIQGSGGKLAHGAGYAPCPGISVTVYSGDTAVTNAVSDANGYFMAALPAGAYRIRSGAFEVQATVEKGTTVLVPLRTGKRMVD